MKLRATLLLFSTVCSIGSFSMSKIEADSLAAQSARAYTAGDHAAALRSLDPVATYFDSPALQLNIGNCWFKLGDVAHAVLHYERGLLLAPGDADLRANLDLANEQVKDRINPAPTFALGNSWQRLRGGQDPDQWARRSLWAGLLFFMLLGIALVQKPGNRKRIFGFAAALASVLLLASIAFAGARARELGAHSKAIIMAPKVDVRGEPRDGAKVLFVLHKGTKVGVLKAENGWFEVELPNGAVGWMPADTIERI